MTSTGTLRASISKAALGLVVDTARAEQLVNSYLAALQQGAADRGWSFLHPLTQQTHYEGNVDAYLDDVAADDWTGFDWEIVDSEQDEPGSFEVVIRPTEPVPSVITELATFGQGVGSPGPTFYVRFNLLGGTGIYEFDS